MARNSITHNATVIANGLMHFGTTSDVFLRENLEWLKRASNWAKFSATASLGLIHYVGPCNGVAVVYEICLSLSLSHSQGHEKEALNLMSSYLPKDSANSSPYAEGGGLYAIGERKKGTYIRIFYFFFLQVLFMPIMGWLSWTTYLRS